jgi:GNAT superfamily N-acetyltransferase
MTPSMDAQEEVSFKAADEADINTLTGLIRDYYRFDGIPFQEGGIRSGLADFLKDPALGRAWLLLCRHKPVGYVILTFGFDLEFGGRLGTVTDLYLEPGCRGQGFGRRTLDHVEDFCRASGIQALTLQPERYNAEALAFYQSLGFVVHDRIPMSKRIEPRPPQ